MKIMPRILVPATLMLAALVPSCAAVAIGAVGGMVGVWIVEDFSKNSGEILLAASPDRVFRAAEAVVKARPDTMDLEVLPGSYKITWKEITNVEYAVVVLVVPGSNEYATLKVYAALHGVKGRVDLAQALAEEIAAKI
jgi:hypothetical protein